MPCVLRFEGKKQELGVEVETGKECSVVIKK
jgi:hypothetical protein